MNSKSSSTVAMSQSPNLDLSEHDEEETPFDDVMRRLLEAKPTPKPQLRSCQQNRPRIRTAGLVAGSI